MQGEPSTPGCLGKSEACRVGSSNGDKEKATHALEGTVQGEPSTPGCLGKSEACRVGSSNGDTPWLARGTYWTLFRNIKE